jgi:hypothetical protein
MYSGSGDNAPIILDLGVKINSHCYDPTSLTPGKEKPVPLAWKAEWSLSVGLDMDGKGKNLRFLTSKPGCKTPNL